MFDDVKSDNQSAAESAGQSNFQPETALPAENKASAASDGASVEQMEDIFSNTEKEDQVILACVLLTHSALLRATLRSPPDGRRGVQQQYMRLITSAR